MASLLVKLIVELVCVDSSHPQHSRIHSHLYRWTTWNIQRRLNWYILGCRRKNENKVEKWLDEVVKLNCNDGGNDKTREEGKLFEVYYCFSKWRFHGACVRFSLSSYVFKQSTGTFNMYMARTKSEENGKNRFVLLLKGLIQFMFRSFFLFFFVVSFVLRNTSTNQIKILRRVICVGVGFFVL